MRSSLVALTGLFLLCIAAQSLAAATIRNRHIHAVDFQTLRSNPEAYQGLSVRFRCTFVQTADLFAPFHTPFTPERHINLVVWDDQASLWRPEERAQPLASLYYLKERSETALVNDLRRFTIIDVMGEVVSAYRDQPWIDVHEVAVVDQRNVYSENDITLLQEAATLNEEQVYDLADQNYHAVLSGDLPPSGRVAVLYLRGDNAFQAGIYQDAVTFLEDGLRGLGGLNGDRLPVGIGEFHFLLARSHQGLAEIAGEGSEAAQPHYQRAVEHATKAIAAEPENGDAHAVLGIALSGQSRFDEARLRCQRAVRMLPNDAEVRWYLGRIYDRQGDYDAAISTLKRAIDLAPMDYRIHKTIAASYFQRGTRSTPRNHDDVVMALREYDISIRLMPEDPDLFYFSGMVLKYAAERDLQVRIGPQTMDATMELAVQRWIACLAVDESYVQSHLELAYYYRAEERHDEALVHYQRAIELRPTDYDLQRMLGEYYWQEGRRQDAYAVFAGMEKALPDDEQVLYSLQRLSHELGQDAQGLAWGDALLRRYPENMDGRTNQAELLLRLERDREVVRMADSVIGSDDDAERLRRVRVAKALAWWRQDRPDSVVETVADMPLVELGAPLRLAYAWSLTLQDEDERDGLLDAARAAVADDPADPARQEVLAWAHYLAGEAAAAEAVLRPILSELDDEVAAYRLGMISFAQGPERYAEAKPLLEQARSLRSRDPILSMASREARGAYSAIISHERAEARRLASEQREAERKAREEARARARAEREARRQAQE